MQPYSSTDIVTAWKNSRLILSGRLDFHIVDNLSEAVHALSMHMLISLSVDEILLLVCRNWSTNFRGLLYVVALKKVTIYKIVTRVEVPVV